MDMKIVGITVTVLVSLVVLAGVLMPVLDDATATTDTFTNDGYFYMQKISASDTETYTLSYAYDDVAKTLTFEYNGDEIDTTGWPSSLPVTVATDNDSWVVRMGYYSEYIGLQGIGYAFAFGGHNTWSVTVTFNGGTATSVATNSGGVSSTYTTTYTDLWLYSPEPTDYVMKKMDKPAYMLEDSEFIAVGVTAITVWNTGVKINGTVDDFTAEIFYPPNLTTTVTNKEIVKTEVNDHEDLYSLDKLTFSINDGTTTVDATYSYFIVPAEVTAERSVHFTDNQNALFAVIPVLIIVAILIGVVALVIRSRLD